jgi:hypothetical protein
MKILLYNPDNGVTRNFMPHLWMFLLQSLTPPGHEVPDRRQRPAHGRSRIARYVRRKQNIGLVGIGAMTRMIAKAYRMADAIRAVGVPVVMGGPHVTEMADEALGRDGGPRHADAVALGEADETWPRIVEDAARGELKEVYAPSTPQARNSSLPQAVSGIPWDTIDLKQFNLVPKSAHGCSSSAKVGNVPHHSRRVRTRLPLRLRVLHRHRILRRLHPLSAPTKASSTNCCC